MEMKKSVQSVISHLNKYKHAVLVLIIGLILMAIPSFRGSETSIEKQEQPKTISAPSTEKQLAEALSRLSGAGEVHVMLSIAQGEQIIYQTDTDSSTGNETHTQREDTVTINDASRNQTGLVRQVIPVQYQGAVVLCSGADDPSVRLAIVDAVSKVTGLGANHISVLKMK